MKGSFVGKQKLHDFLSAFFGEIHKNRGYKLS